MVAWFRADDFFPVPCCAPTCRSVTYLITDGDYVVPIPRLLNVEDHLDYVSNRAVPDYEIRTALEKLWSASAFMGTESTTEHLSRAAQALDCADACGVNLPEALANLTDSAFMIVVQDFQDPYTLNVRQLMKCCVEEITPDWEDSAFVGIYSTQEYLGGQLPKEKGSQPKADARSYLPPIKEEGGRKPSDPINAHERGDWLPEDPRSSPNDWTPALDSIPEESEEADSDSFHSAQSVADNEDLYLVQSRGSPPSTPMP